ncbi:hypothetical protein ACFLQ1_02485 [Candidatus Auribacterota bacterium]
MRKVYFKKVLKIFICSLIVYQLFPLHKEWNKKENVCQYIHLEKASFLSPVSFFKTKQTVQKQEDFNIPYTLVQDTGYGAIKATWTGDDRAFILFEPIGTGVYVSDIFRGEMPKGSAGKMLATSLKLAGILTPSFIRITNILDTQPTLTQLDQGMAIKETILGVTLNKTILALEGKAVKWDKGFTNHRKPWIEATVIYPPSMAFDKNIDLYFQACA